MNWNFVKNSTHGYFEVSPKPTEEELRSYYEEKYYQNESALYNHTYSFEELTYFKNKIQQKAHIVDGLLNKNKNSKKKLLDVGCGEGFTMDFYAKLGWDVLGLDFSDFGLLGMNPQLKENLQKGNIELEIEKLILQETKFDLIWLDNVLEHVVDPVKLLKQCNQLVNQDGVLVIEVPNDYSQFQNALFESKKVSVKYWEAYPDHLSYFSKESLISVCSAGGWSSYKMITDFPIEWFLLNDAANYVEDKSVGKFAHQSRLFFENNLHNNSSKEDLTNFYEALANIGHGRQLIGFFQKL